MNKIMICCGAGMSSSVLVERMKQAAKEQGDKSEITAMPVGALIDHLQFETYDVVMLGPQISFMKDKVQKSLQGKGKNGTDIPFEVINMLDYGRLNGKSVLARAEKLIAESHS